MEPALQEKFSLTALAVLLSVTPFFAGGMDLFGFLFVIICILPLVLFLRKSELVPSIGNRFVILLGIFMLFVIASTATSMNFFVSFQSMLWWFIYFCIFVSSVALFRKREYAHIVFKTLIVTTVLVGLIGIGYFIFDATGYLRLRSVFGQHNALGGFLLLPAFVAMGYFLSAVEKGKKWHWGVATVFILALVILTFSRGTYLSFILAGVITLVFSLKKESGNIFLHSLWKVVGVGLTAAVLATAVFYANGFVLKKEASPNQIYAGETAETNSRTLRLAYWNDAKRVIEEKFLLGVGPGNYVIGNRMFRETSGYFTVDPHNLYLRLLSEVGIGSISLFAFFLLLGIVGLKRIRTGDNDFFTASLVAGIFAMLIHNGMDIDWRYPVNAMVFFAAAGALVASDSVRDGSRKWWNGVCALAVVVFVCGYTLFTSLNRLEDGKYFAKQEEKELAKETLGAADTFNFFKNAEIPYWIADVEKNVEEINRAISYAPYESQFYFKKAEIQSLKGNRAEEEKALLKAIELNKGSSYLPLLSLSDLYMKQGKYKEAKDTINSVLPWFVAYMESGVYQSDPNRPFIASTTEKIKANLITATKFAK